MTDAEILVIFDAQCHNVRELQRARRQVVRSVNQALRKDDIASAKIHTKLFCLIFSSWVEANFSKLIHTPRGFSSGEIAQIKRQQEQNGIGSAWKLCLDLGLRHIASNPQKSNYIPNIRQIVTRLIEDFVIEPSIIRNKISHGQWLVALNRENDALNNELSQSIADLDIVGISRWFEAHRSLANIVELLIESPHRAFHKFFWPNIIEIETKFEATKRWTLATKVAVLKRKSP